MNLEFVTPNYSLLPPHIITHILGYLRIKDLKIASTVCKSWYYASTDPQISQTIAIRPTEENFPAICKTNRKYGVLKLNFLAFDQMDHHYFELFEKFGPFIRELHLIDCRLRAHHFLKLLELTPCLKHISSFGSHQLEQLPGLFPRDIDLEVKNRIIRNLSSVKRIEIGNFKNIPFADLIQYATNLETFEILNNFLEVKKHNNLSNPYTGLFTIFENYSAHNLRNVNWHFMCKKIPVDGFITKFVEIKNLSLDSFKLVLHWRWEDEVYKRPLFHQFILKLQTLTKFSINWLEHDQLSFICNHLLNLIRFQCILNHDQPIFELGNLKQLKELRCRITTENHISFDEIDKFFNCKFEHLQILDFEEFVTESNLRQLCENHPDLIELQLTSLLTRNLEIIFKHLTKLRKLKIYFGVHPEIQMDPGVEEMIKMLSSLVDSSQEYEYKISRLQDLEYFYLHELVNGIREDDVRQLQKLRSTNLPELFRKRLLKVRSVNAEPSIIQEA